MNWTLILYVLCVMILTRSIAKSYQDCKREVVRASSPIKEAGFIALFLATASLYLVVNGLFVREILGMIS